MTYTLEPADVPKAVKYGIHLSAAEPCGASGKRIESGLGPRRYLFREVGDDENRYRTLID